MVWGPPVLKRTIIFGCAAASGRSAGGPHRARHLATWGRALPGRSDHGRLAALPSAIGRVTRTGRPLPIQQIQPLTVEQHQKLPQGGSKPVGAHVVAEDWRHRHGVFTIDGNTCGTSMPPRARGQPLDVVVLRGVFRRR